MYINFKKLLSKGITPIELLFLQAAHQQSSEVLVDEITILQTDEVLEKFEEKGYIKYIKGKKGDSEISKLRTTPKGRDFLLSLQKTSEEYGETEEKLFDWLLDIYKKRPNFVKGNTKEAKRRLHWFALETGITKNHLSILLADFVNNTFVDDPDDDRDFWTKFNEFKKHNKKAQTSNKIENLLWQPKDRFQRVYNLENSPLWNYYQTWKEDIEELWKQQLKK